MTASSLARRRHVPQRSCIACGKKLAKADLIRVVKTPDGRVTVDTTGKRPGRGTYLCKGSTCSDQALKKKRLEYALRTKLSEYDWSRLKDTLQSADYAS